MDPTSLLNLARFVQADPPPFMKPQLPRTYIPEVKPLPPIAPEPLPKPPVSLLWRKLLGYVPVVRFYYAGQAIAEFLADARDMLDDAMAAEQQKAYQAKLVEGAKVYRKNLAESSDPDAEAKRQFEATCYWNCVDRNGADNCLKPEFVQERPKPTRDDFGEPVRKNDKELILNPTPATVQNGQPARGNDNLQPVQMSTAGRPSVAGQNKKSAAGSSRGKKPIGTEIAEDRLAKKLESGLKRFFSLPWLKAIKNFFWSPESVDQSPFAWIKAETAGETFEWPKKAFFIHNPDNPITKRIVEIVRALVPSSWVGASEAHIVEVGAGDGSLSRIVSAKTDTPVIATDLFIGATNDPSRMIADMTDLPFANGSKSVVISSFALEYVGADALKEIFRVLSKGGTLVALVHHHGSSLVPDNLMHRMIKSFIIGSYKLVTGFKPLKWIMPNTILFLWGFGARLLDQMDKHAFRTKKELETLLDAEGFKDIHIETAKGPYIFLEPTNPYLIDMGWIVTAKKR